MKRDITQQQVNILKRKLKEKKNMILVLKTQENSHNYKYKKLGKIIYNKCRKEMSFKIFQRKKKMLATKV